MTAFLVTLTIRLRAGLPTISHQAHAFDTDRQGAIRQVVRDWLIRGRGRLIGARAEQVSP